MKLSVVVPAYNEARSVAEVIGRLLALEADLEVVAVDDGSTDHTWETLQQIGSNRLRTLRHPRNRGKGAAIRTALSTVRGDYVVIQDADLEYDPRDILALLAEAERTGAAVVYGNRIHGEFSKSYQRYYWGGRLLTLITNLLYGLGIHDEPVGYKLFRRDLLQSLPLRSEGFDFCPEVTACVARAGHRIREVPISYAPRSFADGKKITWRDGVVAVWTLLRLRLSPRRRP
jgi:glycosyltransferase involved in cell wall biosynthesis